MDFGHAPERTRSFALPLNDLRSGSAHSVSLKWQSSPTAVSYDLYRSTFSGGPYGLVASAILGTSFVDQSVPAGETYFYVATAWDGTKESDFSNQVTAVVP